MIMDRGLATDENLELLRKRSSAPGIVTTSQSERHELFPKIDRARYVPVKLDRKGKVVVCGQLRRHRVSCTCSATVPRGRARIAPIRQRFEQRLERMPTRRR